MGMINRIRSGEKGQGLVEYGLILTLVSVVAVGVLGGVGNKVTESFSTVEVSMDGMDGGFYTDEEVDQMIGEEYYIPVATAKELSSVGKGVEMVWGKGTKWEKVYKLSLDEKYIQVSNIDLGGIKNFEPIGNVKSTGDGDRSGKSFQGYFDGGGYVINNLTVDKGSDQYGGLFGRVESATIRNVRLINVDVSGHSYVGGLSGVISGGSSVSNCYVSGLVNGSDYTGGLVGEQWGLSEITNSYSDTVVIGSGQMVGGFVGHSLDSVVDGSGWVVGNNLDLQGIGYKSGSTVEVNGYSKSEMDDIINSRVRGLGAFQLE